MQFYSSAFSSNSTVRRVFNIGVPSLSSGPVASGSVRVILEDHIEENVVNDINEKDDANMEEKVVLLGSGSNAPLLPKRRQMNLDGSTLGCR